MDKQLLEIKRQIRKWIKLDYIVPEDIPEIELYMDQVTHFMDRHLSGNKRTKEDKTLTKTMINNYTKNKLLPPPVKKKYSKEHIIILIYIYYLKNVISIGDIEKLLFPMTDRFFDSKKLTEIYEQIYEIEKVEYFNIESSTARAAAITEKMFPKSEDEYLNKMAFIYLLSYDIFSKKRLIEKLIDELPQVKKAEEEKKTAIKAEKNNKQIRKH
ncbi:MAG: DUF1836 domain-containing protein [Eubacterium sp.]|nr:DUF1836 domain-containing protein [Eubacterium sp.]